LDIPSFLKKQAQMYRVTCATKDLGTAYDLIICSNKREDLNLCQKTLQSSVFSQKGLI